MLPGVKEPSLIKFYSWNVFRLEDINESVPGYGNHN